MSLTSELFHSTGFKLGIVQLDHSPEEIRRSKSDPEPVISWLRVQHHNIVAFKPFVGHKEFATLRGLCHDVLYTRATQSARHHSVWNILYNDVQPEVECESVVFHGQNDVLASR